MSDLTYQADVLIVEDEPKLAELLRDYLVNSGFKARWIARGDLVEAAVREAMPDIILLDLMLPGKDGMEVCKELRRYSMVPIMMITARVEEIDRLLGLELGADDYICKPFSPREVVARVKAILRRQQHHQQNTLPPGLHLDAERHQAILDGVVLDVTPVEFRLLAIMAESVGRVYSRSQLLEQIYADHRIVTDRTVDSHIKNLRRKINHIRPGQELIQSVYGVGYKLEST
jgi:two-component system, OmpR family, response regulator BaeR